MHVTGDDRSVESEGGVIDDRNIGELTDQTTVPFEDNDSITHRASCQLKDISFFILLDRQLAWAFDQNLNLASKEGRIVFFADSILNREQIVVALLLDFLGYIVGAEFRGDRPRSLAVFKDETVLEAMSLDDVDSHLKLFVGFAAEADDEIARYGDFRERLANSRHHLVVLANGVASLHPLEDFIRSALSRDVQVVRDFGKVSNRLQQIVRHILGIIRNELQSL